MHRSLFLLSSCGFFKAENTSTADFFAPTRAPATQRFRRRPHPRLKSLPGLRPRKLRLKEGEGEKEVISTINLASVDRPRRPSFEFGAPTSRILALQIVVVPNRKDELPARVPVPEGAQVQVGRPAVRGRLAGLSC